MDKLTHDKNRYFNENLALKAENEALRQKVQYYSDMFAQQSLVGTQQPAQQITSESVLKTTVSADYIHKSDLEKFKLDLLEKINRRFEEEDDKEKREKARDQHVIRATKVHIEDMEMSHDHINKDPFERIAAADFNEKQEARSKRRERLNSGQMKASEDTHCSAQSTSNDPLTLSEDSFNPDNMLILKRDPTANQGKGYFFLAVMFGMMCCSSYMVNNNQASSIPSQPQEVGSSILNQAYQKTFSPGRDLKSHEANKDIERQFSGMNLANSDVSDALIPDSLLENTRVSNEEVIP